ncbi:hypothetical protein D3218_05000 [Aureimonas flava]|uniref:Glycosyltransferase n=1 Tax=Aureimonas flava TaxID=2320271 RepID=A0A3A1WPQ2_9HYPH|nr:hypothetical protein [Aureimonas flava]RIY02715.1 hypothetical protein D3218_05000 [Aureimonas flava]
MSDTPSKPSSIGSLVASRRRRRGHADAGQAAPEDGALRLQARRTGETLIEGHAADPGDPERRFVVELLLDGVPVALARAEQRLAAAGDGAPVGDGCHGFAFALDPAVLPFAAVAQVRLANGGEPVGEPIALHGGEPFAPSPAPAGEVRWLGGLELAGWVHRAGAEGAPPRIEAHIDDATVSLAWADGWREVRRGATLRAEPAFRLRLPDRFADGRLHEVEVFADGQPLPGGPLRLLAFADGLAAHLEARAETEGERLRGERFDRWFPNGVPFSEFDRWSVRFPLPSPRPQAARPFAVAVCGEEGAEASLAAGALDRSGEWIGVVLPERDGRFDPADLQGFLEGEAADCDTVLLMQAGTLARPGGPERLLQALGDEPAAAVAYGDRLLLLEDGEPVPLAGTAFDTERALEQGSAGAPFAMRRGAVLAALGEGAGDLDRIFLHPLDRGFAGTPLHLHVPGFGFAVPPSPAGGAERLAEAVRAHLGARGTVAAVEPRPAATLPAVRVGREPAAGACAILIDAGWHDEATVAAALDALEPTRRRRGASILVSSPRLDERAAARLRLGGVEVRLAHAARSPARRLSEAAGHLGGETLCLLDAGLAPLDDRWLDELLGRLADPGTGLVAPLLVGRAGDVVEAGLALDLGTAPRPRFGGRGAEDPGHGDLLLVAHQVAAVGPAALATRRADFLALGGFDPVLFPRHLFAADYALKLQALGRRVVVTPDARLLRSEAAALAMPPLAAGLAREVDTLSARWGHVLASDPFANPLLRRGGDGFDGLAWPPADAAPRTGLVGPPRAVAPGW